MSAPRWLVTGAGGQLGSALCRVLAARGLPFAARDRGLDVCDSESVAKLLDEAPEGEAVLLNAAAFTQVDRCESERELAHAVNAEAPARMAALCRERGAQLVHVSTDFVFDGTAGRPYTEADPPSPLSEYGRSKLVGEQAVLAASDTFLVARTSWVFGAGTNFVRWLLERAQRARGDSGAPALRVVDDQAGSPTYAEDLAAALVALVVGGQTGLYHLANEGGASRYELARAALDLAGFEALELGHARTAEFPSPAQRPASSVLDCSRARQDGVALRPWRNALEAYLESPFSPPHGAESRRASPAP